MDFFKDIAKKIGDTYDEVFNDDKVEEQKVEEKKVEVT